MLNPVFGKKWRKSPGLTKAEEEDFLLGEMMEPAEKFHSKEEISKIFE